MERTISPQDLQAQIQTYTLIDVRRKADLDADPMHIPGARWQDPEQIASWSAHLPQDKEVILYCVRGGSVSNAALDALRAQGLKARYIEGGVVAWKAAGGAVEAR